MKKLVSTILGLILTLTSVTSINAFAHNNALQVKKDDEIIAYWEDGEKYETESEDSSKVFNCTFAKWQKPYYKENEKYYFPEVSYVSVNDKMYLKPKAKLYSIGFLERVFDFKIDRKVFPKWGEGKAYIMKSDLGYNLCILIDDINAIFSIILPFDFFKYQVKKELIIE